MHNYENHKEVGLTSLRLALQEFDVKSYLDLSEKEQTKFQNALCFHEKVGRVDYGLLVGCLNTYKHSHVEEEDVLKVILNNILSLFKQNIDRMVEFFDIKRDGFITKNEFNISAKRCSPNHDKVDSSSHSLTSIQYSIRLQEIIIQGISQLINSRNTSLNSRIERNSSK